MRLLLLAVFVCAACEGSIGRTLTSVEVSGSTECAKGRWLQLRAVAHYDDGSLEPIGSDATWRSLDDAVARVSDRSASKGMVWCDHEGTTRVQAWYSNRSGEHEVTVGPSVVVGLTVTPQLGEPVTALATGLRREYVATATMSDASTRDVSGTVQWSSSSPATLAVAAGVATAMAPGAARVVATLGAFVGAAEVQTAEAVAVDLELSASELRLASGRAVDVVATGHFSDGSSRIVTAAATWVSDGPAVAEVALGRVVARGVGTARVTAMLQGVSRTAVVTVTAAEVSEIALTSAMADLPAGSSVQLTAVGRYTDGTTQDLTWLALWSSSDPAVMALDAANAHGLFWAVATGAASVRATFAGVTGELPVVVSPARLQVVQLAPANALLPKLSTQQLTATAVFTDGSTSDVTALTTWSSTNPAVVTIDASGVATARAEGTATVRASYQGKNPFTAVTVVRAALVGLELSPSAVTLPKGRTQAFTARGTFADGSQQDLTAQVSWSSTDPAVAAVAQGTGVATTTATGNATVQATFAGIAGTASVAVTAAALDAVQVSPPAATLAKGTHVALTATAVYSDSTTADVTSAATWATTSAAVSVSAGHVTAIAEGPATVSASWSAKSSGAAVTVTAAALVSLGVLPSSVTLPLGVTRQYFAVGSFTDGSSQDLTAQATWSTTAGAVLASNLPGSQGQVTALQQGSGQVRATVAGVQGFTAVTVSPAALVSLHVTPTVAALPAGVSAQLSASGTYTDGSVVDLTAQALWSSSDAAVTVSATGLARAESPGLATVTAAFGGQSASAQVTASAARLDRITLSPLSPSIAQATARQLYASGAYSDGRSVDLTAAVAWASSDPLVAAVSNAVGTQGLATALQAGVVTVSAQRDGVTASTQLTVLAGTITRIDLIPTSPSAAKGTVRQLFAQATLSDGSTQDVTAQATWASSDEAVATVSNAPGSRGLCTAASVGATTVTAAVGATSGATLLTVTPPSLSSLTVTPQQATVAVGGVVALHAFATWSDGSTTEVTASTLWRSSNDLMAAVSNSGGAQGQVTGLNAGAVTITASLGGTDASTPVTVLGP